MARTQLGPEQQLETDIEVGLRMRGHPRELGQATLNLLINAIQSLATAGSVRVQARRDDGGIELSVFDDGIGMTPDIAAKLFEPFFTTRAPGKGLGLGLAVVHGVVTAHAGSIDVHTQPGHGASFRIRLPALHRS